MHFEPTGKECPVNKSGTMYGDLQGKSLTGMLKRYTEKNYSYDCFVVSSI